MVHESLFPEFAGDAAPETVAPRVNAPHVEGPKAQPLALDLFPEVGLFAESLDPTSPALCAHAANEAWCNSTDCDCECAYCMASAERYLLAEVEYDRPVDERADEQADDVELADAEEVSPIAEALLVAVVECAPVGTPEDLIDALTVQIAKDDAAARARIAEAFHPGRHVRQAAR